jgi:hypothetical protein
MAAIVALAEIDGSSKFRDVMAAMLPAKKIEVHRRGGDVFVGCEELKGVWIRFIQH